jgi:hypothetical protein
MVAMQFVGRPNTGLSAISGTGSAVKASFY